MLEFIQGGHPMLVMDKLEQGDVFVVIEQAPYSTRPVAILRHEVIKVLKRDIVCRVKNGEVRLGRNKNIYAYPHDHALVKKAQESILMQNRRIKASRILREFDLYEHGDNDLLNAIEAYALRMKEKEL